MHELLPLRLRAVRLNLGLTQAEAAQQMGVTQPMLHRAETSLQVGSNRLLQILAYYVNQRKVSSTWLLSASAEDVNTVQFNETVVATTAARQLELLAWFREKLNAIDPPNQETD